VGKYAVYETYRNVSCFIKRKRGYVRLFKLEGKIFRYTLNHTKEEAFLTGDSAVVYANGVAVEDEDPIASLLSYDGISEPGSWVGDSIGVSDELPEAINC